VKSTWENPKKSTTAERLATESSVHPETIVTDAQFAEGVQTLKEIREDLRLGGFPVTGQWILRDRCQRCNARIQEPRPCSPRFGLPREHLSAAFGVAAAAVAVPPCVRGPCH
jgi:hypothetical protein